MKVTVELTTVDQIEAVLTALKALSNQRVLSIAKEPSEEIKPAAVAEEPKVERRGRKPKAAVTVEVSEAVAGAAEAEVDEAEEPAAQVEPREGDIDDSQMREIGGRLLREMNAKGKDGVAELTKILASLASKKVTEVPMNLRPRFVEKVESALA